MGDCYTYIYENVHLLSTFHDLFQNIKLYIACYKKNLTKNRMSKTHFKKADKFSW